jgi:hypothetical protein
VIKSVEEKMSVINPNINFPEKKNKQPLNVQNRGGSVSVSTISWTYDFRPMKKWRTIFLCFGLIALIAWHFESEKKKEVMKISVAAETKEVNIRYLEKNLERVKQETIAAENLKRAAAKKEIIRTEPVRQKLTTGPKVYTWINEKGQTVHSNQPPKMKDF